MNVYTFDITESIWDSAMYTVSIHLTKAGAYRAMREYLINECTQRRDESLTNRVSSHAYCIYDHIFADWKWRIKTVQLKD